MDFAESPRAAQLAGRTSFKQFHHVVLNLDWRCRKLIRERERANR